MTQAWPISPIEEYAQVSKVSLSARCGNEEVVELETTEYLSLTFSTNIQQVDLPDDTPCVFHVRVDVLDKGTEKFGMWVSGQVDFGGAPEDSSCSNSYLTVADEDDDNDEMGHKSRYCGEEKVDFHTREDIINVQIYVNNPKKERVKITLNLTPHYLCGGIVAEEKDIMSPDFPQNYDKDYGCLWQIQAPEGSGIKLYFPDFELQPMRRGNCQDYLAIGVLDRHCGTELANTTKLIPQNSQLLIFNSDPKMRMKFQGFRCTVNFYSLTNKDSLMMKFFD
ncbi:hypothetical protein Pcinc_023192 [Petrolisthes cinctipes]|uniref:CUB domain-containing protein n=1 Tax=Petrolisthes cinctipes TaxID=88211 RepID=A0AAE1KH75_PETCI|nr:hypothetical protein Pcinc_023192 [Petrolisthes cinctipes]